jgi:hypothetical protein
MVEECSGWDGTRNYGVTYSVQIVRVVSIRGQMNGRAKIKDMCVRR